LRSTGSIMLHVKEKRMTDENEHETKDNITDAPVFFMNVADDLNAGMLETMLRDSGIPVVRRYPETGQYMHLIMGVSIYGADLYVPASRLEEAKELVASVGTAPEGESSESAVEVRPMYLTDYEAVYKLWTSSPGMGLRSLDDSEAGIARFLDRNPTACFVATNADQVVGSVLAGHDGRRGYLYHAMVSEEFQGKGVGRVLVETALEALKQEGIHKASLVVFKDNDLGNLFWEGLGWERRDDLRCYSKSLDDA
jgi:N-acetylglutamate synthase